ncbi:MAG: polyphosphate kinase 2 family protein [Deltaproteobacteria bacterium]|nr:polyphosphate kinase 2 family protein [Deltaproteobacteria bacterium]MCW5804692.1 polyphosphate kinase 2 family protein [Deltaproteobacteria bacterium]
MSQRILFDPVENPYLVPFDGTFHLGKAGTTSDDDPGKAPNVEALEEAVGKLAKLQERLYAHDRYSVLLVFQAMDAAGKDGTIRAVMSGINPQGCQVYAYKAPNAEELDHDFLWRVQRDLPERGRIGVWNRSHYEEVLVVRVNPQFLDAQRLPRRPKKLDDLWAERFESITAAEKHWARNGCVVLKFFLHVSQREQHERFLARVRDPDSQWKFNAHDLDESRKWDAYQAAYQAALRETSKPWAPWYCIPADSKSYMRRAVAEIVVDTLEQLELPPPPLSDKDRAALEAARRELEAEIGDE